MRTLLKNALVYDGSGEAPRKSDVLLEGERIAAVGNDLDGTGAQVIDLEGRSLAPGFFDAHSHNDWFAIKKQPAKYFEPFVRQGITSFVAGNCGLSAAGFEHGSAYKSKIGGGLFHLEDVTGEYASAAEFFAAIDRNMPMNMALLLGHCSARTSVAGYENRPLSAPKRERMLAILEEGLSYKQISLPPDQAQFLETRKFQTAEIARIFRVPMHMVGDLERATFSNIEQQSLEFVKYCLNPWVIRLEQGLAKALLLPSEKSKLSIRFNVDGLLRGDYASRMKGYSIGIQNGFMSPNDVRRLESMNLIPVEEGGEQYMVNGSMVALKNVGAAYGKIANMLSSQFLCGDLTLNQVRDVIGIEPVGKEEDPNE